MLKPSDCYFCFDPHDEECQNTFMVVSKSFWHKNGHFDDQMRCDSVKGLDKFENLMEAVFCDFNPEATQDDVRAKLLALGFEEKSDML
jgi:hypothetical protein